MAEEHVLEMTLISARNLKDVNFISKMETYVVINLPPNSEFTTKVDSKGGVNPHWNESFHLLLPKTLLQIGESRIKMEIYTLSTLGPKFVGEVNIPLSDVSTSTHYNKTQYKSYPIKVASGDFHGELHISFNLKDKVITEFNKAQGYPIMQDPGEKFSYNHDHVSISNHEVPTKNGIMEHYSQTNVHNNYPQKPTKLVSPFDEPSYPTRSYHEAPYGSPNILFASPLGKILLT